MYFTTLKELCRKSVSWHSILNNKKSNIDTYFQFDIIYHFKGGGLLNAGFFFNLRDCRHSRFNFLVKNWQIRDYLFLHITYKMTLNFFFIIFTNNFKPQYTLSNIAIVTKHQSKNLYPKFYKPLGFFHVLDLDFMVHGFCYHSKV